MKLHKITAIDKSLPSRIQSYLSFTKEHKFNKKYFEVTVEETEHKLKCLCCSKEMEMYDYTDYKEGKDYAKGMIGDGTFDSMSAYYGSGRDGEIFLVTICNNCLKSKLESGNVIHINDYM